jgi:OFA family oxalate/formate antiporter-like MFS transporter
MASLVVAMVALGVVYAWSVFITPLQTAHGLSNQQCQWVFGLLIAVYSLTMLAVAPLFKRVGPQVLLAGAAVLFAAGFTLASLGLALWPTVFVGLLVGISLIAGVGIGLGYTACLNFAMRLYPNQKGLVSGLAAGGFASGAMAVAQVMEPILLAGLPPLQALGNLGLVNGFVLLIAAMLCTGWRNLLPLPVEATLASNTPQGGVPAPLGVAYALKQPAFWLLFSGMLAGTFAGFSVIGNLKPLAVAFGLTPQWAVLTVTVFAAGNALGRVGWGALADKYGAKIIPWLGLSLALWTLSFLASEDHKLLFLSTALLLGLSFGGHFSVFASQVAQVFGVEAVPRLYPLILLAQVLSALSGPLVAGWLVDTWGSYLPVVIVAAVVALAGVVLTVVLGYRLRRNALA